MGGVEQETRLDLIRGDGMRILLSTSCASRGRPPHSRLSSLVPFETSLFTWKRGRTLNRRRGLDLNETARTHALSDWCI